MSKQAPPHVEPGAVRLWPPSPVHPIATLAYSEPPDVAEPGVYAQGRGPRPVIGSPMENPAGCHGTMASCWALVQSRQAHSDRKVGVRA